MRSLLFLFVLSIGHLLAQGPCPGVASRTEITISTATGNQQILAAPTGAGRGYTICAFVFNSDASGVIKITSGTGTNCASATTTLVSLGRGITGATWSTSDIPIQVPAGHAVCLNFSATVSANGTIFYAVR